MHEPSPRVGYAVNPDCKWGIHKFIQWWVVSVPCLGLTHYLHMVNWCEHQFDYVDLGIVVSKQTQEFWFTQKLHAELF